MGIDYDDRAEQVCAGDKARSCAVITRDGRLYRWGGITDMGRLEMEVSKSNMYRWKFRWMTRK